MILMTKEKIARVCHEVNRVYCMALGDVSQPVWEDAPEWQRISAISGVEFYLKNPAAAPEASHKLWLAMKEATGWKYGPAKDSEKKEHPCMLPFSDLPYKQQAKGFIFKAVVNALSCA